MDIVNAVILGIVQGLTEFLPVSSSGHLAIGKYFLDFDTPDILFDVMLHAATLLVVMVYFHKRILLIIKAFFGIFLQRFQKDYFENKRFLWGIIVASIPTAIIGLLFEKYALVYFETIVFVGYALIVTSIVLAISDNFFGNEKITTGKSIIVGIAQGIAVTPGISRSGITIAVSCMLGIDRDEAAEFSFLLSIPAIFGAMILQIKNVAFNNYDILISYGAGMIAAFISGLVVINIMMMFIRSANLKFFAIYCLVLGIIVVVFL